MSLSLVDLQNASSLVLTIPGDGLALLERQRCSREDWQKQRKISKPGLAFMFPSCVYDYESHIIWLQKMYKNNLK